jgi:hypothetical protein
MGNVLSLGWSPDRPWRRHDPASGVLLLENTPCHDGVGGLDHGTLGSGIGRVFKDVADFECSHDFGFCQGSLLVWEWI